MYERGLVINKQGVEKFRGRVALLGATGDIPGISELMVFADHTCTFGCRVCILEGYFAFPISNHGKYFPELDEMRTVYDLIVGDEVSNHDYVHESPSILI